MSFNEADFLTTEVKGELDTALIPAPEGEFNAQIEKVVTRKVKYQNRDTGLEEEGAAMDIIWLLLDPKVKEKTGLDKTFVKQGFFLDLKEAAGGKTALDMGKGKNTKLGQVRDAVGQNDATKTWSPSMLKAQRANVRVKHSSNPNDPDTPYANVVKVTKLVK